MPPQQTPQVPNAGPRPSGHNPYEFIMNPGSPKRTPLLKGSPKGLLFGVGAGAVVIVLLIVVVSLLRGSDNSAKSFVVLAQEQQEIARVAGLQQDSLATQSAKNMSINTQLSMKTDSTILQTYLSKHGVKISTKQLAARTNSATDTKLANAQTSNSLDTTLVSELRTELKNYQQSLQQAYKTTTGTNSRALLAGLNKNASLLLDQSNQ